MVYHIMKLIGKEPLPDGKDGNIEIYQWYVKYPDGTEKLFTTSTWDGISRVEIRRVRDD